MLAHIDYIALIKSDQIIEMISEKKSILPSIHKKTGNFYDIQISFQTAGISSERYNLLYMKYKTMLDIMEDLQFHDLFLIDKKGNIVFSLKKEEDFATNLFNGKFADSELGKSFRHSLNSKNTVVSGFEFYNPSDEFAVFITYPIFNADIFQGAIALQIDNDILLHRLHEFSALGKTGQIIFGTINNENLEIISNMDNPDTITADNKSMDYIHLSSAVKGSSGHKIFNDYRGKKVIAAWRNIPVINWGILVKQDYDELLQTYLVRNYLLWLFLFLFTGIIILFYIYLRNTITIPLAGICTTINSYIKGDSSARTKISSLDEIGLIARTINNLIADNEENYHKIREQNLFQDNLLSDMKNQLDIIDNNIITARINLDGKFTYTSKKFCEISGYTRNELVGTSYSGILNNHNTIKEFENMLSMAETGAVEGELEFKRKNGTAYWVAISISKTLDSQSNKTGYTIICNDISDHKAVERLSVTDELTGLYNRRFYNQLMPEEINRARRSGTSLYFCILDIDLFKQYNDIYGHHKGDEIISLVGITISLYTSRASDFSFRLGGEEFGLLLQGMSAEEAKNHIENLRKAVFDIALEHSGSPVESRLTISAGLCKIDHNSQNPQEESYQNADKALYHAKNNGRNQVVLAEGEIFS